MTDFNNLAGICRIFLFASCVSLATGCSGDPHPKRFPVSGKVAFEDGEPVRTGVIEFFPLEGTLTAHGNISREGDYQLTTINTNDGAVPGKYKVVIKQFIFYDRIPKHKHSHGGDVALKFADSRSTPLTYTVDREANTANFEVEYKKK